MMLKLVPFYFCRFSILYKETSDYKLAGITHTVMCSVQVSSSTGPVANVISLHDCVHSLMCIFGVFQVPVSLLIQPQVRTITQIKSQPRNEKGTSFPSPAVDFFFVCVLNNCTKNGYKGHIEKCRCFLCPFSKKIIPLKFVTKIIKYSCDTSGI